VLFVQAQFDTLFAVKGKARTHLFSFQHG